MEIGERVGSDRHIGILGLGKWIVQVGEREREKDRDWRNGRLATRESFSDFVQFDRLSGILSSFYWDKKRIVFKSKNLN